MEGRLKAAIDWWYCYIVSLLIAILTLIDVLAWWQWCADTSDDGRHCYCLLIWYRAIDPLQPCIVICSVFIVWMPVCLLFMYYILLTDSAVHSVNYYDGSSHLWWNDVTDDIVVDVTCDACHDVFLWYSDDYLIEEWWWESTDDAILILMVFSIQAIDVLMLMMKFLFSYCK